MNDDMLHIALAGLAGSGPLAVIGAYWQLKRQAIERADAVAVKARERDEQVRREAVDTFTILDKSHAVLISRVDANEKLFQASLAGATERLEVKIDHINEKMDDLKTLILNGGKPL